MDKDVEVNKDQTVVVVDGCRYEAVSGLNDIGCPACHIGKTHAHTYCSVIPCGSSERKDNKDVYFIKL